MVERSKLKGRIIEKLGSQKKYAERMGFSENTATKKISGKNRYSDIEIKETCLLLDIPFEEIPVYFF